MPLWIEKDTFQEVELVNLSIKDKIVWSIRMWFGFKTTIKVKVKSEPEVDL